MNALLSTTYFGPIQWYQKLYRADTVLIERCESFQKQTYRNRCLIATTQGVQALTVPIKSEEFFAEQSGKAERKVKSEEFATAIPSVDSTGTPEGNSSLFTLHSSLINSVRISDHGNWRHLHWNALKSAYGESPFFEFYADDLAPFFERRWTFLTDFNDEICALMCQLLDITPHLQPTTCFLTAEECANRHIHDFRDAIRPKHPLPDPGFQPKRYYQVFECENGFLPNLSILDLLMNCGNESIFFL